MQWTPGQLAARVELDDAGRVRLWSARVQRVEHGAVVDHLGFRHELDRDGDSPTLLPFDDDIARELFEKGEGFEVIQEGRVRDPYDRPRNDPFDRPALNPFDRPQRDPLDREPPEIGGRER